MANIPLKTIKFPGLDDTYTVPQVDDTLSVTGAAADAKKTGDELTELNERLNNEGLSDDAKSALLACFEKVAYIDENGQDYYDALYDALYGSSQRWLLKWTYKDGELPTVLSPNDWASAYGFGTFVSGKGIYIEFIAEGGSRNLYPKNYETTDNSIYEIKFNFVAEPTVNGLILRLGNGSTGMQVTINSNGISMDNGVSYLPGISIETDRIYTLKAIHNTNGLCYVYLNGNIIWTGQTASIGNKKNHILITTDSEHGNIQVYISEIKFYTDSSYWDYEWDASSQTIPTGMSADYYDFTTEAGAMFAKTPRIDFEYIGNCRLQIEMLGYYLTDTEEIVYMGSNPQIQIVNDVSGESKRGIKFVCNFDGAGESGVGAVGINGVNTTLNVDTTEYHLIDMTGNNNVYTLSIDGSPVTLVQNTNTTPYLTFTGIVATQLDTGAYYCAYIKSIKFKRL